MASLPLVGFYEAWATPSRPLFTTVNNVMTEVHCELFLVVQGDSVDER
jgi:hypothetical protein